MATPSLNPSHLLISRNPRSPAHPQLNSATTTTTTLPYAPQGPQPGPHLFGVGAGASTAANAHANVGVNSAANLNTNTNSNSNENVGSYTSCSSLGHMRSHSTPAPSGAVAGGNSGGAFHAASLPSYGSEDEVVDIHPTFCRDAALPGRVKVVVGRYAHEFYCHKEVLWYASPFFNAVLQGG
jgi:hypothetical protein